MNLHLYTDGAARGNPGPAGVGIVIYDENGEILAQDCKYLGTATNNIAEYQGLLAGLQLAQKYQPCSVKVFMDSELIVRQMTGLYKVKNEGLIGFFRAAREIVGSFEKVDFTHIPREKNKLADSLANQAIDKANAGIGM